MNGEERALADYLSHGGKESAGIHLVCDECGSDRLRLEFQYWTREAINRSYQVQVAKCLDCGCVTVAIIQKKVIGWEDSE